MDRTSFDTLREQVKELRTDLEAVEQVLPKVQDHLIIRLTNQDKLAMDVKCPYCATKQVALANYHQGRLTGAYVRCCKCGSVWRIEINIKNHRLPDQVQRSCAIGKEKAQIALAYIKEEA